MGERIRAGIVGGTVYTGVARVRRRLRDTDFQRLYEQRYLTQIPVLP